MKNGFFIINLVSIFLFSDLSLKASDESNDETIEVSKRSKRRYSEINIDNYNDIEAKEDTHESKKPRLNYSSDALIEDKSQIYSIPTYDATFKYMLSDPSVCLSFLKTFTLKADIQSIERLDEHLRPVQGYQMAQQLINDKRSKDLIKRISNVQDKDLKIVYKGARKEITIANGDWFLSNLSEIYGDILSSFPTPERNSTVDILCVLDSGAYALVEVQVVEQDYWDQRALAYAASVYSRQMRKSDTWDKLQEVICINILGGGLKSVKWDNAVGFKHYKFKDQNNDPISSGIEILQYPLYYSATVKQASREVDGETQRLALKEWMDFLEHASRKKEKDVEEIKTEGLKKAYEMIIAKNLPQEVKEANEKQDEEVFKRSARIIEQKEQRARAEGEHEKSIEIARKMIVKNMDINEVAEMTGLSVETVKSLVEGE